MFAVIPAIAAGILASLIGYIWYHPRLLGRFWLHQANMSPETMEAVQRHGTAYAILGFLLPMVTAYVLGTLATWLSVRTFPEFWRLATMIWVAFIVPVLADSILWERRSVYLFLMNAAYWLLALWGMAVVLFLM